MSEKKLGVNVVNKKDFYASKKAIDLNLVDSSKIIVPDKFKINDDSCKVFIGYSDKDNIRPLCIVLPQMSGYINYSDNGGKNMPFKIGDESIYFKHSEIWNKNKRLLNTKFHIHPIYDDKYIKTKVKTFGGVISTFFSNDEIVLQLPVLILY